MALREEHQPTLLVFTLGARCESRRRQLLPASQRSLEADFHQTCLDATLAAGRAARCRLEVSSPLELVLPDDVERRPQRGRDFGTRLERATNEAFAQHGGPVLVVGSDVPDLEVSHLEGALRLLGEDSDQVVIGPSPDGGFYLLAASRPLTTALHEVRWRCRETLRSLRHALRREGRPVVLLPPLADLDRRSDLEQWLTRAWRRPGAMSEIWRADRIRCLIDRLARLFAGLRRRWPEVAFFEHRWRERSTPPLRGPPVLDAVPR